MQSSFNVPQNLSFLEYFKSALHYFNNRRFKIFLLILFIFPSTSDLISLLTIKNYKIDWRLVALGLVPVFMLILIAVFITLFVCQYFYYVKPDFFRNVSYSINHWGVVKNSGSSANSKPWRDILKYKETKSFFLLYISKLDFYTIQKRNFNSPEDISDFRTILKERIKK